MVSRPRMTIPTQLVLRALLPDPEQEMYGIEIGPRGRVAERHRAPDVGAVGG